MMQDNGFWDPNVFGKVFAGVALGCTIGSYIGAGQLTFDVLERKAQIESNPSTELPLWQTEPYEPGHISLTQELIFLGGGLLAGAAAIKLANNRRKAAFSRAAGAGMIVEALGLQNNTIITSDAMFNTAGDVLRACLGSSRGSSRSSSNNKSGGAAVLFGIAIVALGASSYVTYQACKANFFTQDPEFVPNPKFNPGP